MACFIKSSCIAISTVNLQFLLVCFISTSVLAELRGLRYRYEGMTAGTGNPGLQARIVTGAIECGGICLPSCGCLGFAISGNKCILSVAGEDLPSGLSWKIYRKHCENDSPSLGYSPGSAVFVNRKDGSENFDRNWSEYEAGFGDPDGEFWLGLEKLHQHTTSCPHCLRVDIQDWNDVWYWAEYASFSVSDSTDKYRLHISGYNAESPAGDSLTNMDYAWGPQYTANAMPFSTQDQDNDPSGVYHCADLWYGGWWYNECHIAHPTGDYLPGGQSSWTGIVWRQVPGFVNDYSFQRMRMTIIPT